MAVEILPIERRHIAGFREVLDAVARERQWLALTEAPPMAQVRRFVLGNLKSGAAQFVAVDDGRVVGWCDVRPKPRETMRHSGVLGMGVAAAQRGVGIGARLLTATLESSFASGITRVELTALSDNGPAIALYRRFGFETEGLCRRYLVLDGVERDALLMAKLK
jgi:ribosomal protein S18 acetylase RimI-like enzyme